MSLASSGLMVIDKIRIHFRKRWSGSGLQIKKKTSLRVLSFLQKKLRRKKVGIYPDPAPYSWKRISGSGSAPKLSGSETLLIKMVQKFSPKQKRKVSFFFYVLHVLFDKKYFFDAFIVLFWICFNSLWLKKKNRLCTVWYVIFTPCCDIIEKPPVRRRGRRDLEPW